MNPPTECENCGGKGWYDYGGSATGGRPQVVTCPECEGSGWTSSEVVWHCMHHTALSVCNPKHTGRGHEGCGWFVPLDLALIR